MPVAEQLAVGAYANGMVARVEGHGGWLSSAVLVGMADHLGDDQTLFVDLHACDFIDSSFVGALVRMTQRFNGCSGQVVVAHANQACARVFQTMHLDQILHLTAEPAPEPISGWVTQELAAALGDHDKIARHVRDCHAALAVIPGPHQAACQAVVEQLDRRS